MAKTIEELVAAVASELGHAEIAIGKVHATMNAVGDLMTEANTLGAIGALLAGELRGTARSLGGAAGDLEAAIFGLHRELTTIAEQKGIDLPVIAGGGGR